MKKLCFIILCLMFVVKAKAQNLTPHPNVKQLEKSVVVVKCFNQYHQLQSYGSGIIIDSNGNCITCYHVLKDAYYVKIMMQNGNEYEMDKIVSENEDCDLVRFSIKKSQHIKFPPVKISKIEIQKGEDVWAMGTPDDMQNINQITKGGITNIFKRNGYTKLQTDVKIAHGSSGGGLFNSKNELVGITASKFIGDDANDAGRNLAISAKEIYRLKYASNKKRLISEIEEINRYPKSNDNSDSVEKDPRIFNVTPFNMALALLVETQKYIFTIAEENPEFIGGEEALEKYLSSNMHYPNALRDAGITGYVVVQFVVTKAGEISDVQVVHGMDGYPFSDEEAKRLVSNMPRWKPGKNSGHAVNVRFTLPIRFQ